MSSRSKRSLLSSKFVNRIAQSGQWPPAAWGRERRNGSIRRQPTERCGSGKTVLSDTRLGSQSAQSAFVIALSDRHTPRAKDVVCGDGMEIEVGQGKRKNEGLGLEG